MVNTHVLSNGTDEVIAKLADDISVTDTNGNALTDVTFAVDEGGEVKVSFKNVEGAGKLVDNLNLGKFVKKIGDYHVFENGEVFYRGISKADFNVLKSTGRLPATSETFTSPSLEYIKKVGYGGDGMIIKFQTKSGTLEKLKQVGVRNDGTTRILEYYPEMPSVTTVSKWTETNALFKTEGAKYGIEQINIGLGKGEALNRFNDNIINFQIIE